VTITDEEREAYRLRVDTGGCRNYACRQLAHPAFSVWWKCPDGHREEARYCAAHGPEHLDMAVRGALIKCACGEWMAVLAEGLAAGQETGS
jgi:hypothetical protein